MDSEIEPHHLSAVGAELIQSPSQVTDLRRRRRRSHFRRVTRKSALVAAIADTEADQRHPHRGNTTPQWRGTTMSARLELPETDLASFAARFTGRFIGP